MLATSQLLVERLPPMDKTRYRLSEFGETVDVIINGVVDETLELHEAIDILNCIEEANTINQGDIVQIVNEEQFFEVVGCCDTHVDVNNWESDIDDIPVGKILCVWKKVGRII